MYEGELCILGGYLNQNNSNPGNYKERILKFMKDERKTIPDMEKTNAHHLGSGKKNPKTNFSTFSVQQSKHTRTDEDIIYGKV